MFCEPSAGDVEVISGPKASGVENHQGFGTGPATKPKPARSFPAVIWNVYVALLPKSLCEKVAIVLPEFQLTLNPPGSGEQL